MCLDPSWTVGQVKTTLAPKLSSPSQDLRIIFAGKELPDEMVIHQCDLGNHSFLHAVRVVAKDKEGKTSTDVASTVSAIHKLDYLNEVSNTARTFEAEKKVIYYYYKIYFTHP